MYKIIDEAVNIEIEFIIDSLKVNLLGINKELMIQYIKYVSDRLLIQLGYNKLYNTNNPFSFMQLISIDNKVNFFEKKNNAYRMALTGNTIKSKNC